MARLLLKNLIGRQKEATSVVTALADAIDSGIGIEDAEGRLILGTLADHPAARHPVTLGDHNLGWVSGSQRAEPLAALLDHLLAKEAERKTLGQEVLHLYREVNLIYGFSEKLAALLDLNAVARLTLHEARQLIEATDGALMLVDQTGALEQIATFGEPINGSAEVTWPAGLIAAIVQGGNAEIVNDVNADRRHIDNGQARGSLICAPLYRNGAIEGVLSILAAPMAQAAGNAGDGYGDV
jgi:hypothetical protein